MSKLIVTGLLWFSALGAGLIAGLFFAFSTFIMTALGRSGQVHGIVAMNSINTTILRSLFMPLFYGTTLTSIALAVIALSRWEGGRSMALLVGAIVYVLGMFVCTIIFNVPLNNALAAVDPASSEGATVWARYLSEWTSWNHVHCGGVIHFRSVYSRVTTVFLDSKVRTIKKARSGMMIA
jgi:uncharacterized membrane protein